MTVLSQSEVLGQQVSLGHGAISEESKVHIDHGVAGLNVAANHLHNRWYDEGDPSDGLHGAEDGNTYIGRETGD